GPFCTHIVMDYYIPLVSGSATCTHMQEVKVSPDSTVSYCESCAPASGYIKKMYRIVSPEMQDYFRTTGLHYEKLPPHNPECDKIFQGEGPGITSPMNGNEYYIDAKDPEPLMLTARTGTDVSRVFWYINDEFYKVTRTGEKQFFVPGPGRVKISCTDDKGRNRDVVIHVSYVHL
ncbi:MAG: penicillin-binding protein 1C, partial [Flavisolibacter sp.]